jgi:FKBP-type peptidyl-prolyl cis-trans isomerase FkpA
MMKNTFYLLSLLLVFGSCKTYSEDDLLEFDNQIQELIKKNGWNMERAESGLYYEIIEEGNGEAYIRFNDQVTFYYTGRLTDGEVFQQIDKDVPLSFRVRELIIGWQEGLSFLKEGGSVRLVIPPHLGYGDKQTGLVPPNSILIYELSVLEVI